MKTMRWLVLLTIVAAQAVSPAADPVRPAPVTTPTLVERAVEGGTLGRFEADLLLARSFTQSTPARYRGTVAADGTLVLRDLKARLAAMAAGPDRTLLQTAVAGIAPGRTLCGSSATPTTHRRSTEHFRIDYIDGTIGGGLTIDDYADALEQTWTTEIDNFDWAAPPLASDTYFVKIDPLLEPIYYGYVAGDKKVGDNPNTAWTETESYTSCMVIQANYDNFLFPSTPWGAMAATVAHEFNHSVQFGYGAITGPNSPNNAFIEGGASWMEDEVFDDANDSYFYLWPDFREPLGANDDFPYSTWILYRGLTERFGPGTPGGAEQVFQNFWEQISKGEATDLKAWRNAMNTAGTPMAEAYHSYAVATKFSRACGGGYTLPLCYEEGDNYREVAGTPRTHGFMAGLDTAVSGTVDDHFALYWIQLEGGVTGTATLENTSAAGTLRGSIACDTGSTITVTPLPTTVGGGAQSSVAFDTTGCVDAAFTVTNETVTANKPTAQVARSFTASLSS